MTNRKNTKRALYASVISMLLCVTMLIGSTFAWFTDNATTKVNTIQAGTLDIQLLDAANENANSLEGKTLTFAKADGAPAGEEVLFEPGAKYSLQQVWLYNVGNLHAKYKVVITGIDGDAELAQVLDVYVAGENVGTLASLVAAGGTVKENSIAPKEFDTFGTIELMMQTTAGNEYQGKTLSGIAITVMATQDTVEYDSHNNTYDADATFVTPVTTADELYAAINKGEAVVMMNDITLNGSDKEYLGTADTTSISIDGNGHTLTFDNVYYSPDGNIYTFTIIRTTNPDATLSISNVNITRTNNDIKHYTNFLTFACNTSLTNVELDQSITLHSYVATSYTYNLNNVTIDDTRTDSEHYAMFIVGGQTVNMNGCKISVAGSGDRAIKIVDENAVCLKAANLTISNTSFKSGKKAAIMVGSQYGANIALSNVDISAVAADTTNAVWVDSSYSAYADKVVVTGGTKIVEN